MSNRIEDDGPLVQNLRAELAAEKLKKRPWSDEHTKNVIEGQVKEIDRLQALLASERASFQDAIEKMLELAQGTRIREVQAMNEAKWDQHHRDAAQEDWNELNAVHRKTTEHLPNSAKQAPKDSQTFG